MTDEELQAMIAAHGQDALRPLDPRWERWTLGELSAEEERELLDGADPALVEMFRPLDASVARAVTERWLATSAPVEVPPPANRSRHWLWALATVAVAAVALLVASPRMVGGSSALPDYALSVQGSSEVRGAPTGEVPTVREGGSVVLRLRPASRTDLRAEVTVLADETPLPATVAWTDSGAAEVRVASVPAGTHELHVRLSAPGADPVELVQPIRMVP